MLRRALLRLNTVVSSVRYSNPGEMREPSRVHTVNVEIRRREFRNQSYR